MALRTLPIYLSVCLSISLSVSQSVCVSAYLFRNLGDIADWVPTERMLIKLGVRQLKTDT